ncbi:hypothetical protein HELRODRAFT_180237 [Helobdella robusta]|uniref:Acid-sensing ion channel 1 n=1 Tax=Helobdella robusta TaxID=6412 RepID=T1FFL8_HELRO|nr:hypothetical protein HELRODRAFT_180237 [Helobdella robusta]ESN94070.1 hypothetical protein HELRODRAFT_180237 [Helobdella robusta]
MPKTTEIVVAPCPTSPDRKLSLPAIAPPLDTNANASTNTLPTRSASFSTMPNEIDARHVLKSHHQLKMYKIFKQNLSKRSNNTNNDSNNTSNKINSTTNNNNNGGFISEDANSFYLEANLIDAVDEISIIGFRHCVDTNRSLLNRLMWITLLLTGFSLAVYQINDRIAHYFEYPTSTEIDVVPSQNMTFPRVTICNDNFIKLSGAQALGKLTQNLESFLFTNFGKRKGLVSYYRQFMSPFVIGPVVQSGMKNHIPKLTNQTEIIEKMKFLSPGMEQFVSCFWNGMPCPNDFVHMEFTNLGHCLFVNPRERNLYVTRPGAMFGLMLFLDANQSDYFAQPSPSAGYRVLLHEPNEPPRMMELGFKVHLGQAVNVDVSVTNITRQRPPYGSCTDEEDYNQVDCEWKCLNEEIVKNCSCRPIYMKAIDDELVCDYYEERSCAEVVTDEFYLKKSSGEISCSCPPVCNEITYQAFVTASSFSKKYFGYSNETADFSYIMDNNIFLSIYISSMQYTKLVSTEGYSTTALLSDLGGALGLILGSTFLTVVEIVELIMDLIVYGYAKKKEFLNSYKKNDGFDPTAVVLKPFRKVFEKRNKSEEKIYPYEVDAQ